MSPTTQKAELDNVTLALGAMLVPMILALTVGSWMLDAFVLWKLWTWHAVPLGTRVMSYSGTLGLWLFFSVGTAYLKPKWPPGGEWKRYGMHLVGLALAFGLGWLVK
jgi:hypothetical protein